MNEKQLGEELVQMIRTIVRNEVRAIMHGTVESFADGVITKGSGGKYDVRISADDIIVTELPNKTGEVLNINDCVRIYYTQNNYARGYIGYKY